jgi:dienelactone hydrolase
MVKADADVLGHFAEHDDFEPIEQVHQFEEALRSSGRQVSLSPGPQERL